MLRAERVSDCGGVPGGESASVRSSDLISGTTVPERSGGGGYLLRAGKVSDRGAFLAVSLPACRRPITASFFKASRSRPQLRQGLARGRPAGGHVQHGPPADRFAGGHSHEPARPGLPPKVKGIAKPDMRQLDADHPLCLIAAGMMNIRRNAGMNGKRERNG